MTIRKGKAGETGRTSPGAEADGRVRRPEPARRGPIRASPPSAADPAKPKAHAPKAQPAQDPKVSDAVAHAVKMGYDVITENIRQGREAAQRFRQGEYSLGDAPGDLEVAALRLLHLARELSTTTFDVCERLLKELGAQQPPRDRTPHVPGFRAAAPAAAPTPAKAASPTPPDAGAMKVTVRFEGASKAIAHTYSLTRPRQPTAATDVSAAALAPAGRGGAPIAGVRFEMDASVEGIVAVVNVPKGQAHGFYSGLVHARGDPIPLGVLTIEIAK
jgi:hypothetical protein